MAKKKSKFLSGKRIDPTPIDKNTTLADLVDESFMAYNAARIREACRLFTNKMLEDDVTVGITLTGALTPAGLGISAIIPLIKAGFIDWIISTGANLYHDTHFGIGLSLHQGDAKMDDRILRDEEVVRIYDIFFDYSVLLDTDEFFRRVIEAEEFQRSMSSAEFHYLVRKIRFRTQPQTRTRKQIAARRRLRIRRADLYFLARRFINRNEHRRQRIAGKQTRFESEFGCQ
ncbi:MAG: deoxyhypusine synthase family protein [Pyrinomonadaceae bacterium]